MWTDEWKRLIAATKFIEMPNFGTFKKGHIALQGTEKWQSLVQEYQDKKTLTQQPDMKSALPLQVVFISF